MALHACFYFRGKKGNSTKNEHGDVCFLINYKFLCKISFKIISFLVSVVTLCDIFYSRFKRFLTLMFFTKKDFSLKNKRRAIFLLLLFCVLLLANSM